MKTVWSNREVALVSGAYLISIALAAYGLSPVRWLALSYIGGWIIFYILIRWMICTKCRHYGERCIILGGECAAGLFKKREGKWLPGELRLTAAIWVTMTVFPLIGLAYLGRYYILIAFFLLSVAFQTIKLRVSCRKCEMQEECPAGRYAKRIFG
ncbi:MAG: hypothetical protein JSU92_00225 [Deltaproteobacteria bacterium]|nr:MAG: hypothetical protein JSU92_00225 [Deltaproteobacteria bacterium]